MVPHVGETDTDTLTEIPGRPAEAEEEMEEEEEDEFGYNWSEFTFSICKGVITCSVRHNSKKVFLLLLFTFTLVYHK